MTQPKAQHEDTTPWDQKTQEEKARSVCDHLVHEHLAGNLRPVSQETKRDARVKPASPKR